jgi:hypothetical protein
MKPLIDANEITGQRALFEWFVVFTFHFRGWPDLPTLRQGEISPGKRQMVIGKKGMQSRDLQVAATKRKDRRNCFMRGLFVFFGFSCKRI